MKKASAKTDNNGMRAEYDFTGGVRGKHHRAIQAGYTITIHQADGATVVKEVQPKEGAVVLAPDVREYFPDSESVNTTLRSLIRLIPDKPTRSARKAPRTETRRRLASGSRAKPMKRTYHP